MPQAKKGQKNKGNPAGVTQRLGELLGDQSVSAFARKCGIGDSLMRKYLGGANPSSDRLAQIAIANDVTVDWLATGEGPKQRSAFSQIGLARDAALKFALKRSIVPERRVTELVEESFRDQLDLEALERRHGKEFPLGIAQPGSRYEAINLEALRAAIQAIEERMPRAGAAAKSNAATAIYEHMVAKGTSDAAALQGFVDLIVGAAKKDDVK